eukprot:353763-Chlamydomonas_euryale.AAC.1
MCRDKCEVIAWGLALFCDYFCNATLAEQALAWICGEGSVEESVRGDCFGACLARGCKLSSPSRHPWEGVGRGCD